MVSGALAVAVTAYSATVPVVGGLIICYEISTALYIVSHTHLLIFCCIS